MAQGLRSRRQQQQVAGLLLAALGLCGCGDSSPTVAAPRVVDTAGMSAAQLCEAVLAECHGELEGVSRCSATVSLPDGTEVQAFVDLPDRIRAQWPGARMRVLDGARGFAVEGEQVRDLTDDERSRISALRTLLDAALLGPLYRAERRERQDQALRVVTGSGDVWTVTLRQLVPTTLAGPGGTVHITDWLRTQKPWMQTWIPCRAELAPLGSCELQFGDENLVWDEGFFAPPRQQDGSMQLVLPPDSHRPTPRLNLRPAVPSPFENRAMQWVVFDDPGDWPGRAAAYRRHHEVLVAQDQQIAGFAGFQREGDRALMIVPFRQRDGGPPLQAPPGWVIRDLPATPVLEVYPGAGSFEERVAAGSEQLRRALQQRGSPAAGPILAQPFFDLQDGVPAPAKLQSPVVRVSVPLR